MKYFLSILIGFMLLSCDSESNIEKEIKSIPMEMQILRFDKEFSSSSISDLPELKKKYPAFFPKKFHDSIWIAKMRDTLQQQLNQAVLKVFPSEE